MLENVPSSVTASRLVGDPALSEYMTPLQLHVPVADSHIRAVRLVIVPEEEGTAGEVIFSSTVSVAVVAPSVIFPNVAILGMCYVIH